MNPINSSSASKLRLLLAIAFVLLIVGLVAGYQYGNDYLTSKSSTLKQYLETNATKVYSSASILKLKNTLDNNANIAIKIDSLFAPSASYQSVTQNTLNNYASRLGIGISSFAFDSGTPSSANVRTVSVKFNGNVNYSSLYKFLEYIENTTPKMQVAKISLNKVQESKSNDITVEDLALEVYVR